MDESFFMRARRLLGEQARPRLDHPLLLAQITKRQAASPTARLAIGLREISETSASEAAATLIAGASGWRGARAAQSGCFNRAVAARGRNTP